MAANFGFSSIQKLKCIRSIDVGGRMKIYFAASLEIASQKVLAE